MFKRAQISLLMAATFLLAGLFFGCSNPAEVAGAGVDVPNSVTGTVTGEDDVGEAGRPVALAKLKVSLDSVEDVELILDTTDSKGNFSFTDLDTGRYVLSTPDQGDNRAGARTVVRVLPDSQVRVRNYRLRKMVDLFGRILVPTHLRDNPLRIKVTGMRLPVEMLPDGYFAIPNAPRGGFQITFIIGRIINTFSFHIPPEAPAVVRLPPLELSVFAEDAQSEGYEYRDVSDEIYQIVPRTRNDTDVVDFYILDENGEPFLVESPRQRLGDALVGVLNAAGDSAQLTVSAQEVYFFPLESISFPYREGQEVLILVNAGEVVGVKPLDDSGLQGPPQEGLRTARLSRMKEGESVEINSLPWTR